MKPRIVMGLFGSLMKLLGVLLLVPGAVAAYYGEPRGVIAFALTSLITLSVGIILSKMGSGEEGGVKEGFAIVAFGWLGVAFFGSLPHIFLGTGVIDGLFESMSGFTTTGASILTEYNDQGYWVLNATLADRSLASALEWSFNSLLSNSTIIEPQPAVEQTYFGLLFWRSFSQWLGGMGIILLFIAILPRLGVAGRQLYKAEVPGPDKEAITPRIRETAKLLWWVYVLFTAIEAALLFFSGMPLYDSICNSFSTMATGGFSPKAESIAGYNSPLIEGIIVFFMFLAGANFVLHYRTLYRDRKSLFLDPEFRLYSLLLLVACVVIFAFGQVADDPVDRLRLVGFQVVSIMTTTGFATDDFDQWSNVGKIVLLILMFIGGSAGSTSGAIKVIRIQLALSHAREELFHALHPRAVTSVRLGGVPIKSEIIHSSMVFIAMYIMVFTVASLALAVASHGDARMDISTILSAVATTLGNVGPGFGIVGPSLSFAEVHPLGKMILFFCMWIGRLEVVTALVILHPEFWKK